LPFRRKLIPAAFPVLTTTSWLARTEVCAGAMRVSSATGLPSATIDTQVFLSARISKVKVLGGFSAAVALLIFAGGGLVVAAGGFAGSLGAAEPVVDAAGDLPGDAAALEDVAVPGRIGVGPDEVVAVEIVPGDSVPADSGAEGGFPTVSDAVEPDGRLGGVAGAGTCN
jgi:hypothetical protein